MKIEVRLWLIYSASPIQKSRSNRAESRVVDIYSGYEQLSALRSALFYSVFATTAWYTTINFEQAVQPALLWLQALFVMPSQLLRPKTRPDGEIQPCFYFSLRRVRHKNEEPKPEEKERRAEVSYF